MAETEIPQDVRELAQKIGEALFGRHQQGWIYWPLITEDGGPAETIVANFIMADRASRAPDPSRDGLVEALRVYEEVLGDLDSVENKIMLAHRNGADVTEFEDDLAEATAACIKAFRRREASK